MASRIELKASGGWCQERYVRKDAHQERYVRIANKKIGLIWSRELDKHGINVLYSHADSSFSPGHSDGC